MFLRYNQTTEIDFFMPDDSDPWSGKTGLTNITVQYKKQGQSSFTTLSSPTITELGNGWYKLSVPTTMVDTHGFLVVRFSATGAKPQQQLYQVVAFNPYDSAGLGLSRIDAAISSRSTLDQAGVQSALSAQGYTTTRAGNLDRLDVTVSSRMPAGSVTVGGYVSGQDPAALVWSASSRTLTSFGSLVSDVAAAVWAHSSRTLTSFGSLVSDVATAVWSASTRTLTSFGSLASDVASAVWGYAIEAGQSALYWMRLMGAVLFNRRTVSGNTYTHRDWADTKDRIVGTVDSSGNREITTRDGS